MRNYYLVIGLVLASLLVFMTFVGPHLSFIDSELNGERILFPEAGKFEVAPFPPSEKFLLGSDREGRDLLSIIVVGAKDTLLLIILVVLIRYFIAVPLGLIGRRNKGFISWIIDVWNKVFSSFPVLFSAALILTLPFLLFHEHRYMWSAVTLALIEVGRVSAIVKEDAYSLSQRPFIDAGITIGVKPIRMLIAYYLPNLIPTIVVNFFIDAGRVAMLIGQLAIIHVFLTQDLVQMGYGMYEIINTSPDWAAMLRESRKDLITAIWIPFFPMLALVVATLTFNILGEGLRQHFNRHLH